VYAFRCAFCRDAHLSGELWRYLQGTIPWFQKVVRVGGKCGQEDDFCTWFAIPIMAPNILFPEQESLDRSWSHAAQEVLVARAEDRLTLIPTRTVHAGRTIIPLDLVQTYSFPSVMWYICLSLLVVMQFLSKHPRLSSSVSV